MTSPVAWSHIPERGSYLAMRCLAGALTVFGYRFASTALLPITLYFFATGSRSRAASLDYLSRLKRFNGASPDPTFLNSYRHHLEFAQVLLDRVLLWQNRLDQFTFSASGKELLDRGDARGSVLIGSHLGSFDVLRVLGIGLQTRVHVVMHRLHAARINRFLSRLNPGANLRVVEIETDDISGVLRLKEYVDRGEHVGILGDRHPPGSRKRSTRISFLGHDADFPEGPWILAGLLGCPVNLVSAVRTGLRAYRVRVEAFTDRVPLARRGADEALHAQMSAYVRRLEHACCEFPLQWFNFYDFWKTD